MATLSSLSPGDRERLEALVQELKRRKHQELCRKSFLAFVKHMWPIFINGRHHVRIAHEFEDIEQHKNGRLIINLGPRHTKSEFASVLLPAWYLGLHPDHKVIQCSVTAELAVGFGRRVRNMIDSPEYREIFPTVALQADSKAAGRWATNLGGNYFAIGVSGSVTGIGADLCIIDDPHDEQTALQAITTPEIYEKTYQWYESGPRQRLQPGGNIVVVMCMTGDTRVRRVDGSETLLRDIRPGAQVATYDAGKLTTSKVLNWQSNGIDFIYKIRTTSGIIVRANERHPFLVQIEGVRKWIPLKELKIGMAFVSLKGVTDLHAPRQYRDYVTPAGQKGVTTKSTQMPRITRLGITENIKGKLAKWKVVASNLSVIISAKNIKTKITGHPENMTRLLNNAVPTESNHAMALPWKSTNRGLKRKVESVRYVVNRLQRTIREHIGTTNYALTTATTPDGYAPCSVTTVISPSLTQKPKKQRSQSQNTSDFTTDRIVEIVFDGKEEVFDLQVDRTENFIANGVVSHNTRWSKMDLTAQLLDKAAVTGGEQWKHISFPAILPSGKPLWPEFWSLQALEATRTAISLPKWNAQYLQQPTSDTSAIVKRTDWQRWPDDLPPPIDFILQTLDTAFEKHQRADYSAIATWGVFYRDDDTGLQQAHIILLDMVREKAEFPRLKQLVKEKYDEYSADKVIIERKASGAPLIYELRSAGIPCSEFTPTRASGDKTARLNAVTDLFASKRVWAPNRRFADELIEEVASFPNARNDDLVDVTSMALAYFRTGGFIRTDSDLPDEIKYFKSSKKMAYY